MLAQVYFSPVKNDCYSSARLAKHKADFLSLLIWQLRTSYLTHIKDGVGERLINLDPSAILSNPSLRAAGYGADIDSYRTYSPPIPTATTVAAEYFAGPKMGINRVGTDEHDGGMVTGRGSTETVGPAPRVKRRRMREQHEEDDSSDLSDDSDEDAETTLRAAQSIKFAKMPVRTRADSSPMRGPRDRSGSEPTAPEVFITHPTVRRTSSGNVETVRPRARRDTTTSSDMSSENELDPSTARRRVRQTRPRKNSNLQQTYTAGDDELEDVDEEDENKLSVAEAAAAASDASDLSSEFDETIDSESLLDPEDRLPASPGSADLLPPNMGDDGAKSSPTKRPRRAPTPTLKPLPPARPISQLPPISALGQALKAKNAKPKNPVEPFARFSGKGALDPLNIRIYAPFCKSLDDEPFDMPLMKMIQDSEIGVNSQVTVADALGLALWRYHELKLEPEIALEKLDVNRWEMRMVDDGEVEYDFPALQRTKNIVDFASNNTRPVRGRGRGKAYDEFALVEASDAKYAENKKITPKYTRQFEEYTAAPANDRIATPTPQQPADSAIDGSPLDSVVPKPFAFTQRKGSTGLADTPTLPTTFATPRTEQQKHLKIRFVSVEGQISTCVVEFTIDTYLAAVLDNVCRRWGLDKAHHFLKVTGTSTIAPLDRTIEALGNYSELDLARRRFARDNPTGLGSSPASASPNAPLLVDAPATPSKKGKKVVAAAPVTNSSAHPLAQMQDVLGPAATYKKYSVMRKQPMSFAPSHPRTLLLENEYLHILPGEEKAGGKNIFDTAVGKTTTVPFGNVVGSKVSRRHPKSFRVLVFKDLATKRYDFEASNPTEAAEIVGEIQAKIKPLQGMVASNYPLNTQPHNWG